MVKVQHETIRYIGVSGVAIRGAKGAFESGGDFKRVAHGLRTHDVYIRFENVIQSIYLIAKTQNKYWCDDHLLSYSNKWKSCKFRPE